MGQSDTEPRALTAEQVNVLFRACRLTDLPELLARDHAMVAVLVDCGLTSSEFVTLRRDRLRVAAKPDEEAFVMVSPKNGGRYKAPLGLHARKALERYLAEGRPQSTSLSLFLDDDDKPFTPRTLGRLLKRLGERVEGQLEGVPVTARTLRQTYLVTKSGLGAGESVLDAVDTVYRKRRKTRGR